MTASSVLTLVDGDGLDVDAAGPVGLLCEMAPDAHILTRYPGAIGIYELLGDPDDARARAAQLVEKLVADEPVLRGTQQLRVFEEVLKNRCKIAFHVLRLVEWLRAAGIKTCVIPERSWLASYAQALSTYADIDVRFGAGGAGKGRRGFSHWERVARIAGRLRDSKFSGQALREEWRQVLDRIDPFHRRPTIRKQREDWRPGEIWFYSTAHTFTRIGLAYEPYFPAPFGFLVENAATGGAPLGRASRPFMSIYQVSARGLAPSRDEIKSAAEAIETHLTQFPLSGADALARDMLVRGEFFAEFKARLLPTGLYQTALFEEWAERCRPRALVVGNPVFESYALSAARKRGIPTIFLQHGAFGPHTTGSDPPADHFVLQGPFWKKCLPGAPRARSTVLNVPESVPSVPPRSERRSILFLTAPYSVQPLWAASGVDDILSDLLQCASEGERELIVRVHPMEKTGDYRRRVSQLTPDRAPGSGVTFSQGGAMDDVLARSAVAVTFSSSAFLDCLRWQVPVVTFGWHDFEYKKAIAAHGVFNFAGSRAELKRLVLCALDGKLPVYANSVEPFAAHTSVDTLRRQLSAMVDGRIAADELDNTKIA